MRKCENLLSPPLISVKSRLGLSVVRMQMHRNARQCQFTSVCSQFMWLHLLHAALPQGIFTESPIQKETDWVEERKLEKKRGEGGMSLVASGYLSGSETVRVRGKKSKEVERQAREEGDMLRGEFFLR